MQMPSVMTNTNGKDHRILLTDYYFDKKRQIWITGEINDSVAQCVIQKLQYLDARGQKDIYLYINSPGGSVSAGLAIYDCIQYLESDVVTVGIGVAASMGAFLLASGKRGKRYATSSCEVMIHQPFGGVSGQATDISLVAEHITILKKKLAGVLAEKTKKSFAQITLDMERDYWLDAESAKNYGLIDYVGFPE
ncbi:MAG: ATP-dependent Clp protease proteolytic subunit [Lachnospiraceae bacterium]|nr:ATP-dependent Clp protease proteolytic subunit [Lachnospiraceae bacterium]